MHLTKMPLLEKTAVEADKFNKNAHHVSKQPKGEKFDYKRRQKALHQWTTLTIFASVSAEISFA